MSQTIVFEQPLNERVRTLLRLEHLFQKSDHFLAGKTTWDSRSALEALLETLSVLNRADLKKEYVKEMERHTANLSRLKEVRGVDIAQLEKILHELSIYSDQLLSSSGIFGQELRQNELLNSMRQRASIAGGTCDFDLPMLHYWLEQPAETRQYELKTWYQALQSVRQSNELLISLIRKSAIPKNVEAENGFFQESLDSTTHYQLIRVTLSGEQTLFPEISAGRHRFTVRFMEPSLTQRPQQANRNIRFQLTLCAI
ncbi:MAG: cell division protein ZapD [Pseudomonadota bacterium]